MINIKAQQTLVKFNKQDPGTWLYLMRPETYSKLTESKVIDEAAVRSGIQRGALKGAWDAIGAVIWPMSTRWQRSSSTPAKWCSLPASISRTS